MQARARAQDAAASDDPPATRWGIVADDLTGSADSGVFFAGPSPSSAVDLVSVPSLPTSTAQVNQRHVVVDTDSRNRPVSEAITRVGGAVAIGQGRGVTHWYKKVDSTLHGHVAAELMAFAERVPLDRPMLLLCPAVPAQGRLVRGGMLRVAEAIREVDIVAMLRSHGLSVEHVPELDVEEISAHIGSLPASIDVVVADATNDCALDRLADVALGPSPRALLPAGASGFARALARRSGLPSDSPLIPRPAGIPLVLLGSSNPATVRQAHELSAAQRWPLIRVGPAAEPTPPESLHRRLKAHGGAICMADESVPAAGSAYSRAIEQTLARYAATFLDTQHDGWLVLAGGATARAVLNETGIDALEVQGELAAGVPLSRARLPAGREVTIATKAGGFGGPHLLVDLLNRNS